MNIRRELQIESLTCLAILVIFIMCVLMTLPTFAFYSWVIGGAGTGADKNIVNGGGYRTGGTATWNTMQGTNGAPTKTITADGVDIDSNGGDVRLTDEAAAGTFTTGMVVGQIQNIDFTNTANYLSGRFEILSIADADTWTIDYAYVADEASIDITVYSGGALANPGEIPDSDDFNNVGAMLTVGNKIWIRALADFTTVDESDSILYINTAGTASAPIIWEGHFAEISSETGDFGIVTFDANGKTNAIETAVGGSVYHIFVGISCENATDDGANFNTNIDDRALFIRCQFVNNGVWGLEGDDQIAAIFCDFDSNGSAAATDGGIDTDTASFVYGCVLRGNTGDGAILNSGFAINNLVYNNTGDFGLRTSLTTTGFIGNTIDMNNVANSVGIVQDGAAPIYWFAINNTITDSVTGIRDDAALRQGAALYYNLYNSNTADTNANITPVPSDGDNWGNLVKNVAENVLWTADDNTYILASAYKESGVDAFYTRAYWDDFNGGAGDNPPDPLTGLAFPDSGAQQREEAGGGRTPGIGKGIGG